METNHPARLFQMSNASGRFTVDEIPDFTQQDLVSDDVMILDVWDTVYVWIGEGANKQERDEAERLAIVCTCTFIWTPLYVTMTTHVVVCAEKEIGQYVEVHLQISTFCKYNQRMILIKLSSS